MRHADAELRLRRLGRCGEEGNEVFVFSLALGQARDPSLVIVGIRDGKFCFCQILAIRVRIDEGLKSETAYVVTTVYNFVGGLFVKDLVRLIASIDRRS